MISIIVNTRHGTPRHLDVPDNISLMEAVRASGIDELLALCGGCCSCATCHVYLEEGPAFLKSPQSDDENDLLESSDYREPNSRFACQVLLSQQCQGLVVSIAPED